MCPSHIRRLLSLASPTYLCLQHYRGLLYSEYSDNISTSGTSFLASNKSSNNHVKCMMHTFIVLALECFVLLDGPETPYDVSPARS